MTHERQDFIQNHYSKDAQSLLQSATARAQSLSRPVGTDDLLLALFSDPACSYALTSFGVTQEKVAQRLEYVRRSDKPRGLSTSPHSYAQDGIESDRYAAVLTGAEIYAMRSEGSFTAEVTSADILSGLLTQFNAVGCQILTRFLHDGNRFQAADINPSEQLLEFTKSMSSTLRRAKPQEL